MTEYQEERGGSFSTGFALGLFAGAAGYYLFATDEGAKLRRKLVVEWEEAKVKLAEEGVLENPNVSLREFISQMLQKAFSVKLPESIERPSRLLAKADRTAKKKETGRRFRGV